MPKYAKITNHQTNYESPILTSNTNKELKKKIKDISQQVLKRNDELYKALEKKGIHIKFKSPCKISTNCTEN